MTVYFDNAATTRVRPEATAILLKAATENYGNPSSTHEYGRLAADMLNTARGNVARCIGAKPLDVIFTSGGTEANNLALFGGSDAMRHLGRHIITSQTEHASVLEAAKKLQTSGWDVTFVAPDKEGRILPQNVLDALREDTALVSVMLVNNEVGTINPIADIAELLRVHKSRALLHTDAVQGFGKIPFTAKALGADLITVSAHKIYGPKGAGALFVRGGCKLTPRTYGGAQEYARRAGTEAVPAIAAFGEAARLASLELDANLAHASALRARCLTLLAGRIPGAVTLGGGASPYIMCLSLPGYLSEHIMSFLEGEGIYVARSAACKKGAKSHVLEAMRLPKDVAEGAIRVSFSRDSALAEVEYFAEKLKAASERLFQRL